MKDYYLILGVARTASAEEIDAAYRKLARRYHPDLRPEEEDAAAQFKSAAEAHEVLSNVEKRREYDRAHARRKRRVTVGPGDQGSRARREPETGSQGWTKTPWAGAGRPEVAPRRPSDVEAELRLVPEEAARGGPMEVRISVSQPCSACDGQGHTSNGSCAACEGQGVVWHSRLLRLRLPPGLCDGTMLCVSGYGRAAAPHASSGDLYLRVRVRPCW